MQERSDREGCIVKKKMHQTKWCGKGASASLQVPSFATHEERRMGPEAMHLHLFHTTCEALSAAGPDTSRKRDGASSMSASRVVVHRRNEMVVRK